MITFLRKMRSHVLSQNKFKRYAIYAIGEIILVVIGILIALQINTANENQKQQKKVEIYLNQFKKDLSSDVVNLEQFIKNNATRMANIDSILMIAVSRSELSKKEMYHFIDLHWSLIKESYFVPEKTTFNQLVASSQGDYLENKDLRTLLFKYYSYNDRNEKNNEVSTQLYMHNYITKHITNTILISDDYFESIGYAQINRPSIDFKNLSMNTDYVSAMVQRRDLAIGQNENYQIIRNTANALIKVIDDELTKK